MNEKIEEYLKLPISEIDKKIDANDEILDKIWREDDRGSWDEHEKKCKPYWDDNYCLCTAKALLTPREEIKLSPMDDIDRECRVPIKTFKSWCDCCAVTSYDGVGYYATKDEVTRLNASTRAFYEGYIRDDFEYVCWYNK